MKLGSHRPYPFEAFPEGNRAHLAAESLLFARIVTEGLFGLKAVGLNLLHIKPQLSQTCSEMSLKNIRLFSKCFDVNADLNGITIVIIQIHIIRMIRMQYLILIQILLNKT